MAFHDREYYRGEERPLSVSGPAGWSMVTKLIVVTAGIYVVDVFTEHALIGNMAASAESLVNPLLWWRLLTYGFAHSIDDSMHIFWNMLGLWVFGRQVEELYGPKELLRIYLVTIVLGGLVWATRAYFTNDPSTLVGASGAVTAITLLFCIHYPKQTILLMMVLPVPAWVVGAMIIIGNLVGLRRSGGNVAFDVHLVGAAFAIAYFKFGWHLGRWWPGQFSFSLKRLNPFSRHPRLRVHRPGEESGEEFEQLEAQADHLLEKVKRDGLDSLTSRERKVLEDYSRRMRNKRR